MLAAGKLQGSFRGAGRGAEELKERKTRNYYHIEIEVTTTCTSKRACVTSDRKLHDPLGRWEQEQGMHIALGVSRRWYHMSRNSSENVSETSVCIHYVPLFFFHWRTRNSAYCQWTTKIRKRKLVVIFLAFTMLSRASGINLLSVARTPCNWRGQSPERGKLQLLLSWAKRSSELLVSCKQPRFW